MVGMEVVICASMPRPDLKLVSCSGLLYLNPAAEQFLWEELTRSCTPSVQWANCTENLATERPQLYSRTSET